MHYQDPDFPFPVTLSVPADAAGPVSGEVGLEAGSSERFAVTDGAGTFTLEPGESKQIEVTYDPDRAGEKSFGTIGFGVDGVELSVSAFATDNPKDLVQSAGRGQFGWNFNYAPFESDGARRLHSASGLSYGADESWVDCVSSGAGSSTVRA